MAREDGAIQEPEGRDTAKDSIAQRGPERQRPEEEKTEQERKRGDRQGTVCAQPGARCGGGQHR